MPTETQLEQRVAALQSDLNDRDQALDDAATENNERELSRRDWFEEAQRLEKEVEELRALLAQPAEPHQGHSVVARVCAYTPGMGQVELKLPGNLPTWLELGEEVTVLHGGAQHQGEPVAKSSLTFEFLNPLTNDRRTVSLTHAQVADGMEDTLYEKLNEEICSCEPVGETNVVECNCWGYTGDFGLVARQTERPEPISSTSDKYKAELYDEVWQRARGMGFGNVTDALMKLQSQLQGNKPR